MSYSNNDNDANTHTFRAMDGYEYVVALAGLEYMTDNKCFGYDENGIATSPTLRSSPSRGRLPNGPLLQDG